MEEALTGRQLRGEPLRCPIDGSRLVQTERSEILIDACPECRGVWLDRGELDRILVKERQWASGREADEDFFREVEGRRRPPERERERHDDRDNRDSGRRKKRRGGFLEDLFEGFD